MNNAVVFSLTPFTLLTQQKSTSILSHLYRQICVLEFIHMLIYSIINTGDNRTTYSLPLNIILFCIKYAD